MRDEADNEKTLCWCCSESYCITDSACSKCGQQTLILILMPRIVSLTWMIIQAEMINSGRLILSNPLTDERK
jgi:hypothetical protein